jgi:hypothetical protein
VQDGCAGGRQVETAAELNGRAAGAAAALARRGGGSIDNCVVGGMPPPPGGSGGVIGGSGGLGSPKKCFPTSTAIRPPTTTAPTIHNGLNLFESEGGDPGGPGCGAQLKVQGWVWARAS